MFNLANVKKIVIPEGNVIAIDDSNNVRIWQALQKAIATGVSPLALPGAAASYIYRLKQYGKCELQNPQCSPTQPTVIYTNNGIIVAKDRELPSEYKRVLGIEFNGNVYYDTQQYLYGTDDVSLTVKDTSSSGQNLFGSYNGTSAGTKNFSLYIYGTSSSGCYFRYGETLYRPKLGTGKRTISFGCNGTTGFYDDVNVTPEEFESSVPFWIGGLPNSSSPKYTGSIEGNIEIKSNGGNRLKFIPCERKNDGAIGYYEIYNDVFIEPTGSNPTSMGYDYSYLDSYYVESYSPETLSIYLNGQQGNPFYENIEPIPDLFGFSSYKDDYDLITGIINRKVGVKILTGDENWSQNAETNIFCTKLWNINHPTNTRIALMCTHYYGTNALNENMDDWTIKGGNSVAFNAFSIFIKDTTYNDVTSFKAYLKNQLNSGNPVIVVYPLEEPTEEYGFSDYIELQQGDCVVEASVSNISSVELEVEYNKQ